MKGLCYPSRPTATKSSAKPNHSHISGPYNGQAHLLAIGSVNFE